MLKLELEQPDELKADPGHAGDPDAGEVVTAEHLLDVPLGDHVPGGRAPVARHDHAAVVVHGHDRGPVREVPGDRRARACRAGQQSWSGRGDEVGKGRGAHSQACGSELPSQVVSAHEVPSG